jgi:hypothetical protein
MDGLYHVKKIQRESSCNLEKTNKNTCKNKTETNVRNYTRSFFPSFPFPSMVLVCHCTNSLIPSYVVAISTTKAQGGSQQPS